MAATLGATLEHRKVMEAALDVGLLGLKDLSPDSRALLSGMVLLFRNNQLHVVGSRGLTRTDEKVVIEGREGIIGKALRNAEPVIGNDAHNDPELQFFVALAEAKSILVVPLRAGYENYGTLVFSTVEREAFDSDHIELMTAIGSQAIIALQNAVLYRNLANEKERLVEAEEAARKKLARDLHDGPTQSVSAIAMRIEYMRRALNEGKLDSKANLAELAKVEEIARRTTKDIRHMLFTLRPLVLETQGLVAALQQLAAKNKETYNLNVILNAASGTETLLDTNSQGALFYIVEEALNNARKHAQAEHIYVRLYTHEQYLVCEIEDDGVGFDMANVTSGYDQRNSFGMLNMHERAEIIGGRATVDSVRGRGTKISILIAIAGRNRPSNTTASEPSSGTGKTGRLRAPKGTGSLPHLENTQR
jgi:signal transduction histidine kinase